MSRVIIFEASPKDSSGNPVIFRMCSAMSDARPVNLDGKEWKPVIKSGPKFTYQLWGSDFIQPQPLDVSYGQIDFLIGPIFENVDCTKYQWAGSNGTVWVGETDAPFSSYRQIWTGRLGPIRRSDDITASVALLGPEAQLTSNLLDAFYQGTGNAEGPSTMLGNLKPFSVGDLTNVEGVLVDPIYFIYQVDGYDACPINAVYSNALILKPEKNKGNAANFASLKAATLAPGEWATCNAEGLFRLGSDPASAKITADVGTVTSTGAVLTTLFAAAGVTGAALSPSITNATGTARFHSKEQVTIADALRKVAIEAKGYLVTDSKGVWYLASHTSTRAASKLSSKRSAIPLVRPDTVRQEVSPDPIWRVKVGHTRVWAVHSASEVSEAVATLGADLTAANAAAQAAQDAANLAAADGAYAKARVLNQQSDTVLDRTEKLDLVHDVQVYTKEKNGLVSTGNGLSNTAEVNAYVNAYNALISYLNGLSPAYTDTTQDTPITSALSTNVNAYLDARQSLTNANFEKARKTANWPDVVGTGKPEDGATVGALIGGNLVNTDGKVITRLEDGADVTGNNTAKDTNAVAGTPSTTVRDNAGNAVEALKNSAGVIVPVRDLLVSERATTNTAVADAKKAGTDAQAQAAQVRTDLTAAAADAKKAGTDAQAQAAQVRTDLTTSVNIVRDEAAQAQTDANTAREKANQAQTDANTARTDLATEVSRAKGEEGAIRTTVASVKQTADGAASAISDELTVRANADSAISNRLSTVEADYTTKAQVDSRATVIANAKVSDEATARANADSAITSRTTKLEASMAGVSKVVANDYFDNGVEGWDRLYGVDVVPSSYGRSSIIRTQPGVKYNEVIGRKIAITSDKQRFKLKASWRSAAVGAVYYFGAVFYDANDGHVAASDGTGNYPLANSYYVDSAQNNGWIDREVIIGKGIPGGSVYGGTTNIPAGAVYFRQIIFINYTDVPGSVTELDYFAVEDVTEAVATNALISDEVTARATADSAISGRVSTTEAKLDGSQDSTLAARIRNAESASITRDDAIAGRATVLETSVNNGATGNLALQGKISDEATTRSNADSAISNRVSTTEAKLDGSQDSTLAARIRDEATARVNSDGALANRANILEAVASSSTNSLNGNPNFSLWPDGQPLPSGMNWWNHNSSVVERSSSTLGRNGFSLLFTSVDGEQTGLGWDNIYNTPGFYVMEADVWMQSGPWEGSGLTLGGAYNLDFLRDPDTNGGVGELSYGGVRRFSKLINFTDSSYRTFHPMVHWDGFSSNRRAKRMLWLRAVLRPATAGEILAQKANSTADSAHARITDEATASANRDSALATRASALETSVNTGPNNLGSLSGRISDEATSRAQNDGVLSGRISTTEAQIAGGQDSWLAARIRDTDTASVNRDSALTNRTTTLESKSASLQDEVNKRFPGFEAKGTTWGWETHNGGRLSAYGVWEPYHAKGAGIAFSPGFGDYLYMDPFGWIKTTPGKRYRAGFWVWQWSAPNGFGGKGRLYWEGHNESHTAGAYLGSSDNPPEATIPFYNDIPNGAWHCYASDIAVDDAMVDADNSYWIRPRINIDYVPPGAGYVIAGWFFREVTGEYNNAAKISEESTTRTNADSALAIRATNLETSVNNGSTGNLALQGKISDEATTRSNNDSALATRATTLEAAATNAGNLVPNSAFTTLDGWFLSTSANGAIIEQNRAGPNYQIGGIENNLCLYQAAGGGGIQAEALSEKFAVQAGEYYQVQALTSAHRARAWVSLFYWDASGNFMGYAGENFGARINVGGQTIGAQDITGNKSHRAPDGSVYARVAFRLYDITVDGYGWFSRPYVGVVKPNTDQWNSYSPGNDRTVLVQTNAKISEEATARANADSAMVTRANNLEATVFNGPNQNSSLSSRISDEVTARTNAFDTLASRSNTLESQMSGSGASGLQTLIRNNRKNLIDTAWWRQGAGIPWPLNGGQRNEIVNFPHGGNFDNVPLFDGSSGDAWLCQADGSGGAAGGWQSSPTAPLDPDKTYRFIVPIAHLGGEGARQAYWGTDNVCDLNTTNPIGNPYFAISGNMTANRWYLFVGYIFPRNSTGKTHAGAGVWDMVTGEQRNGGLNYNFRPDGAQPPHRAYQYYAYNGSYQAFGRPLVELVDGTETPFASILSSARGVTAANARINNEETTRANADSALATRTSKIEASYNVVSSGDMSANARFANWPDGARNPTGWIDWLAEGAYSISRVGGIGGSPYAVYTQNDANVSSGFYQGVSTWAGKWVVEVTARRDAGSLSGAGVTLSGIFNLDFLSDPDTNGQIRDSNDGETRTWVKMFDVTQGSLNLHAMHGWQGFGRSITSKYITWFKLSLRPAGPGDIAGVKNAGDLITTNARIGNEETARANADSALSSRTSTVEAQVSNDSGNMLRNGIFNAPWIARGQTGTPPYWNPWVNDNNAFIGASPRDSRYGAPAPLQIDRQGLQNGVYQIVNNVAPGWYAFEVDITGEDGNWSGSGLHCNFNNGSAFNFGFATNPDTAGRVGDIGTANRQFTWLFENKANTGQANIYLMSGWPGFQGDTNFGFFRGVWHRVVMRPATAGEIAARKVMDSNIIARVESSEGAIATIDGKTQAYFEKKASVPGAEAFISAVAKNDNGVATSNVAIGGTSIALYNTENGTAKRAMYLGGGAAIFDGSITATTGIIVGTGKLKVQIAATDYAVVHDQYVSFGYDLGRAPSVTFGPCPVGLNTGEVYAPYAAELSSTGFRAKLLINSAPQSSAQATGAFANQGGNIFQVSKGGRPNAANGQYSFVINLSAYGYAYTDGDYR